jgi:hypothetical protein
VESDANNNDDGLLYPWACCSDKCEDVTFTKLWPAWMAVQRKP